MKLFKSMASLVLVPLMAISFFGACGSKEGDATSTTQTATAEATATTPAPFKIGILTSTVSQAEDEYRAAQQIAAQYPGRVIHMTYPDNFMQEQETTVSNAVNIASDPTVKALIIGQAVPGSIAAAKKAKRVNPELLVVFWNAHEDPTQAAEVADLIIDKDNPIVRGQSIMRNAKKMGAKYFIHYSFPRHMAIKSLADRRVVMEQEAKAQGVEFVYLTAPDPMGEGGLPAAQQYMLEDIPRQIEKYGVNTAFFTTNDGMTEPLIKKVAEGKAIFVEPDTPSPTMGYPGALGLNIPADKSGDYGYINDQIRSAVAKLGNTGRMGAWPVSASIIATKVAADVIFSTNADKASLTKVDLIKATAEKLSGVNVTIEPYPGAGYNNFLTMVMDPIIY